MTDIVERLRNAIDPDVNDPIDRLLEDAITEIEQLRNLAGAVSSGQSFREIKHEIIKEDIDAAFERVRRNPGWILQETKNGL